MLDINLFREEPDLVRAGMRKRGIDPAPVDEVIALDIRRRELLQEVEELKAERNTVSKEIGKMKDQAERQAKIDAMGTVNANIGKLDDELKEVDEKLKGLLAVIPNIPDEKVPEGFKEEDNVVTKQVGEIPEFDFEPKPHWDLGPELGIIDFEQGVKVTGSRFYVLSGPAARLQRALIAFMLDLHIGQGYLEKYTPFMVKGETLYGSGQLPKFADNLYKDHEEDLYMVPTAEVPLTGIHMDEIIDEESLPLKYTAYTPCFRREKMSAGRDVRGIKRGHQFDKVEMYKFCKPEDTQAELEGMIADAEATCVALGLPYQVILKCAGDTGDPMHISYDIEVWAAGCQEWLETSTVSNAGTYQSRRANIRYRESG